MEFLEKILSGSALSRDEAAQAMEGMMLGSFTQAQSAALLVALKAKGETEAELFAFAEVMQRHAVRIMPDVEGLTDTCGTGGDSLHTFNISTAAALIAAGAGAAIAKHGNRSVSSKCGSADVLEALGVKMLAPAQVKSCIEKTGFGFMFAPFFHPAMKNIASVRRELGIRTLFNMLGPLANPAGAAFQLVGAYDISAAEKMAGALRSLGSAHALVVNSHGMDEIGLGITDVFEVSGGNVERHQLDAAEFGLANGSIPKVQSAKESAEIIIGVLQGKEGSARDIALLNAGAALYVSGKAQSIKSGLAMATDAVDSGKAKVKLDEVALFCGD